jgi:RHS repeat-associated protein
LSYAYDPLNRLTNVLSHGQLAAAYSYDLDGNLTAMRYGDGVTNQYQYDSLNRLTNLVWGTSISSLAGFAYRLGATGNRTNLSENLSGTAPIGTLNYQYDAVGNRLSRSSGLGLLSQSLSYKTNDWLASDGYDANGNTTNSAGTNYLYDCEGRLTNFNNGQVILIYDADGNRVKKIVGTTTTFYLVDTLNPSGYPQVLEELTVSGGSTNLSRSYTWGLSLISQRIPGSSTNFYGFDGHGSTRFLTDLASSIANTYTYDAFGNLIQSSGTIPNNFLYCCYQSDPDVGLVYDNARYLNLNIGRFWTLDGEGYGNNEDPLSLHKYLYVADNPVDGMDPSGHDLGSFMASVYVSLSLAAIDLQTTVAAMGGVASTAAILDVSYNENLNSGSSPGMAATMAGLNVVSFGGGKLLEFPAWAELSQLKQWIQILLEEHSADAPASRQAMAAALQFSEEIVAGSLTVGGKGAEGADIVAQATVNGTVQTLKREVSVFQGDLTKWGGKGFYDKIDAEAAQTKGAQIRQVFIQIADNVKSQPNWQQIIAQKVQSAAQIWPDVKVYVVDSAGRSVL